MLRGCCQALPVTAVSSSLLAAAPVVALQGYDAVCIFVSAQDAAVVLAMLFARCTRMCGLSISARSDVSRLTMHHAEVSQRQRAHALPSQTYFSDR